MHRTPTVDRILRATSEIVSNDGIRSLTLDAVAQRAGVSKGGLLYHFPSKHALLRALVLHDLDEFEVEVERRAADLAAGPGRRLRASVEVAFDPSQAYGPEFLGALIGVFAEDPSLLEEVAARFRRSLQVIDEDADDRAVATLVRLALDGLFLADAMGLGPVEGADREALKEAMSDLASGRLRRSAPDRGAGPRASAAQRLAHQTKEG
jgi:AcrR family transcriptional regulator